MKSIPDIIAESFPKAEETTTPKTLVLGSPEHFASLRKPKIKWPDRKPYPYDEFDDFLLISIFEHHLKRSFYANQKLMIKSKSQNQKQL